LRENLKFGGGAAETFVDPVVAVAVVIAMVLVFALPRKRVVMPLLAASLLIPMGQVLVVGGVHLMMLRVMIVAVWIRILRLKFSGRMQFFSGGATALDKALVLFGVTQTITFVLLWKVWGAVINQAGFLCDLFGMYFALRFLVRDKEDAVRVIRVLVWVVAVVAATMVQEVFTGHSVFAVFGAARFEELQLRGERARAVGPFLHPILAGVFGATLLPLFIGLWNVDKRYRALAVVGLVSAAAVVFTSASSTPVLVCVAIVIGFCCWPLRDYMKYFPIAAVGCLVGLHMVMKAPVWALIGRINVVGGSSGYHREMLVDQCIRRFGDWWLLGVKSTEDWGWDMWDQANQFVAVAENHGLLALIMFVAIIVIGFRSLARRRRGCARKSREERFLWAVSIALTAFTVAFFGIALYDQTEVSWYAFLAIIGAVTVTTRSLVIPSAESDLQVKGNNYELTEIES
jgi:hypothetical protein